MSHDPTCPPVHCNMIICQEMQGVESGNRPLMLSVLKLFV